MTPPLHVHTSLANHPTSTIPSPSKPHHPGSRLRNLFTPHKSATFAVTVTIHSVQNVPQVRGFFSVGWKFRDGEGNGRAKVDVIPPATQIKTGDTSALPSKLPLPLPRNLTGKRRSLDTVSSSSASILSRQSADNYSIPPTSPNSIGSFSSGTGGLTPIAGSASVAPPLAIGRGKKSSMDSSRMNEESIASGISVSTDTSVDSSRRTSISGDVLTIPSKIFIGDAAEGYSSSTAVANGTDGSHGSQQLLPSASDPPHHLKVPIQHSRSTKRKTHSLHKPSSSSLRGMASKDRQASQRSEPSPVVDSICVPANTISERQGCTPIAELHNHSCEWGTTVTHLVRMKIHPLAAQFSAHTRPPLPDSPPLGLLGAGARSESGIKFKVWQHIRPPTAEELQRTERLSMKHRTNGRSEDSYEFGGLNLDLAEFVGEEGKRVTRRYLLTERAKTNATIKLTIEVKQVAGETNFVAPIMQKRHIVAGLAEDIISGPSHGCDLHLTRSIASSQSDVSSMSATAATSCNPSLSNLRPLDSSLDIMANRSAPAMRLKKPPEEHLLKPPQEVTKSSTASKTKSRLTPTAPAGRQEESHLRPSLNLSGKGSKALRSKSDPLERRNSQEVESAQMYEDKHDPGSSHHRSNQQQQRQKRHERTGRHKHHPHHVADPDAAPERVIEAVFNPKPSSVWTPFTYVDDSGLATSDSRTERPSGVETATPQRERRKAERQSEMRKLGIMSSPLTANLMMTATDSDTDGSVTTKGTDHESHERERRRRSALRRRGKPVSTARRPVAHIRQPFFKRLGASQQRQNQRAIGGQENKESVVML